jgi:hypothetical protein
MKKKFKIFLNYFGKKGEISPENKKHWTAASTPRQVGTVEHEGEGEPHERLGQSAKRIAPVPGHAGRGSYSGRQTSAGCTRAEVGIFGLPGFVEDRGHICLSRGSLPRFLLHARVLRVKPTPCNLRQKGNACSFWSHDLLTFLWSEEKILSRHL